MYIESKKRPAFHLKTLGSKHFRIMLQTQDRLQTNNVQVIGQYGAQSFGFSANTLPAYRESLEAAHGFCTSLSRSMDGHVYCLNDINRTCDKITYDCCSLLSPHSAKILGQRRIDECLSNHLDQLTLKNGGSIPKLIDSLEILSDYPQAQALLELRGEGVAKDVVKILQASFADNIIQQQQIMIVGFEPATLQTFRSKFSDIKIALQLFPENFPRSVKLYPWSVKDFSCYIPFKKNVLESPLMKRLSPDIFLLDITTIRENTVQAIHRAYKDSKIGVWFDQEPPCNDSFALFERLKNNVIAPHISCVLTQTPRQMYKLLQYEGISLR